MARAKRHYIPGHIWHRGLQIFLPLSLFKQLFPCSLFVKIKKGIDCAFAEYPIYPAIIVYYKIVIKAFYF
jgi:hypothetical protein